MATPRITNEPILNKRTGAYYKRIPVNGVRKYFALGKDKDKAEEQLLELLLKLKRGELDGGAISSKKTDASGKHDIAVKELAHKHLEWVQANRSCGTYNNRRGAIKTFLAYLDEKLPHLFWVSEISFAVLDEYLNWARTNKATSEFNGGNTHYRHIKTMLKWGYERELCEQPRRFPKMHVIDGIRAAIPEEHLRILLNCPKIAKDFISNIYFTLLTGLRPMYSYQFKREWIKDLDGSNPSICISKHKTTNMTTKYQPIVIPLTKELIEIVRQQIELHPDAEYLFLNADGNPYNKNTFGQRFRRACKTAGIPRYCPYQLRSAWATYCGVEDMYSKMKLMGHSKITTTASYQAPVARILKNKMNQATRNLGKVLKS